MPRKILLIDGDEDSLAICSALFRHQGHDVVTTRSPDEGIGIARSERPDIIFTEIFTLRDGRRHPVDTLRTDPMTTAIPLVVLTSRVLEEDRDRVLASGCARFLNKPIQPNTLIAVAESLSVPSGVSDPASAGA